MTTDQFDEFFEDVQKDIRAQRFANLWKKYGKLVTAALLGIFVCAGFYVMWKQNLERENYEQALKFTKAEQFLMEGRKEEALGVLSTLTKGHYGILARFQEALHNPKKAMSIYKSLASNASVVFFQDLARVLYVNGACDALRPEKINYLKKFLEPALTGPWQLLALDLKGFLLYSQQKYKEASEIFIKVAQDPKAPENLKLRAQLFSQACARKSL